MEKGYNMSKINHSWVLECRNCLALVSPLWGQRYIDEVEHQDGEEYWMQFETISSVIEDFHLVMRAVKGGIYPELHNYLDHMIDHLIFEDGDSVTEIAELSLKAGEAEELVIISKDQALTFSEIFIQYHTTYNYDSKTKQKTITETDTMYYHDDGSEYTPEELEAAGIDNPDGVRVWKSLDI